MPPTFTALARNSMSAFAAPEGEEKKAEPLPLRGSAVLIPTEPLLRTLL
ncbi:MAG: hypothetical protein RML45_00655 [Acetobacteraceae bacterium]|nr:hypothetical protein [Acetobacteraceae bacterium]